MHALAAAHSLGWRRGRGVRNFVPRTGGAPRGLGALVAVGLHLLAGVALLSHEPARSALGAAVPIMVELITPPAVEAPKAKPKPIVKPRPKPPAPKPIVSAPVEAPARIEAPAPPPEPLPPEPEPAAVAPAPAPAPAPQPVPPAVVPPIFNADYLQNPPPAYPPLSRRLGEEGRVVLHVLVNPAGTADEVQIRKSSGHARLDEAAREAVLRWTFVPAKRGPQPISAWILIPISFRLES